MKKFSKYLREQAKKIISFKKKKMKLLTNKHRKPNENAKICCNIKKKKKMKISMLKVKKYNKFRYSCHYIG